MLKEFTLSSLGETKAGEEFEAAMATVRQSLTKDGDIPGTRSITIKLSFKPDQRGYIEADMHVTPSVPRRKVKSLAMMDNGALKIDTATNDARQPGLPEMGGKVAQLREGR